jgi:hypothetical protein
MKVEESLDKSLFWDVNPEKLEWQKNSQFIIERILTRGFTKDVKTIFSVYTKDQIKSAVLKSKTLDKKTANYMSIYLSIPLSAINVAPEYY